MLEAFSSKQTWHSWYISRPAGNKCDLEAQRQVLFEDACTLAERTGALAALETSAKQHHNIEEAFELMARELIVRHGGIVHQDSQSDSTTVFLHSDSHPIDEGEQLEKRSCDCWLTSGSFLNFHHVKNQCPGAHIGELLSTLLLTVCNLIVWGFRCNSLQVVLPVQSVMLLEVVFCYFIILI